MKPGGRRGQEGWRGGKDPEAAAAAGWSQNGTPCRLPGDVDLWKDCGQFSFWFVKFFGQGYVVCLYRSFGRTSDLRRLVVNWDIGEILSAEGSYQLHCWPQSTKTLWRQDKAIGSSGEVGKVLHQRIYDLCTDYLARHYQVIVDNMGPHARHHKSWSTEVDGDGADRSRTLFPGYWDGTQRSRFNRLVHRSLGCGLHIVRQTLNKRFMQAHQEWNITRQAVDQQLLHSADVSDRVYLSGLRNTLNPLQSHLYGWADFRAELCIFLHQLWKKNPCLLVSYQNVSADRLFPQIHPPTAIPPGAFPLRLHRLLHLGGMRRP